MIDTIRREIKRQFAQARFALRAVSTGMQIATRIQRANAEGLAGEQLQDVEVFQHFGFTSAHPDGSQLIVVPLGGRTSASVVLASEHGAYRLVLDAKGEAAIYNQWGDFVHLKQDRTIAVNAAARVDVVTPLATFSGNVTIGGDLQVNQNVTATGNVSDAGGAKSMAGMRAVFNGHDHTTAVGPPTGAM